MLPTLSPTEEADSVAGD